MTTALYKQIKPWAVFRISNVKGEKNLLLARFKKRTDAEEYAKLHNSSSTYNFEVVFDA